MALRDKLFIDGEPVGRVVKIEQDGDYILVSVTDDDGEWTQYPFAPFVPLEVEVDVE